MGVIRTITVSNGRVTAVTAGAVTSADMSATGVTPGTYSLASITVDAAGRITAAASGSAGAVTSVDVAAPAAGLTITGGPITGAGTFTFALADDLAALEALTGTNTIYYRSAASTWSPVVVGSGLSFAGGTLTATGTGGTVTAVAVASANGFGGSSDGNATAPTLTLTTSVTGLLKGDGTAVSAAVAGADYLTPSGAAALYQPLDGDLTSLAAATATNSLYYRSAASTWSPVGIGSGLSFSGGTLSATGTGGTVTSVSVGNLSPLFTSSVGTATTTPAVTFSLSTQTANTVFAGPTTGSAAAPTFRALVAGDVPDLSATYSTVGHTHSFASLTSKPTTLSGFGITDGQPLDATLTALAALTIAANSLTVGTGADAFAQTTFAANTFPARASSGSLVAKTITDFGLSLVDDVDATAARSTLGLGTAATANTGTGGAVVPLLNGNNTWSALQQFGSAGLSTEALSVKTTGTAFYQVVAFAGTFTAHRTFTVTTPDANTSFTLTGNATLGGTNTGDQTITLTGDVTGSGTGSFAATIGADKVLDTMLRNSAALSVIGRASNSTGDPADIAAASEGQVLRRSGTALGFGAVDLASANAITGTLPRANAPALVSAKAYYDSAASAGTDMAVAHNTFVAVPLKTEAWDTNAIHDNATNPTRFTVPSGMGGKWLFTGLLYYPATAGGVRAVFLRKNGATYFARGTDAVGSATTDAPISVTGVEDLAAGDYVEIVAYQNSGGSITLSRINTYAPSLTAYFLG